MTISMWGYVGAAPTQPPTLLRLDGCGLRSTETRPTRSVNFSCFFDCRRTGPLRPIDHKVCDIPRGVNGDFEVMPHHPLPHRAGTPRHADRRDLLRVFRVE